MVVVVSQWLKTPRPPASRQRVSSSRMVAAPGRMHRVAKALALPLVLKVRPCHSNSSISSTSPCLHPPLLHPHHPHLVSQEGALRRVLWQPGMLGWQ
jgi:hypothetical protein